MANLILICDDNNQNNHSAVVSFFSVQPKMPLFCLILAVDTPPPPRHEHPLFPIGDCETFYIIVSIIAQSARFETRDLKALQKQ